MGKDYCPYCRKVTPHIKDGEEKLCKKCGKKERRMNFSNFTGGLK